MKYSYRKIEQRNFNSLLLLALKDNKEIKRLLNLYKNRNHHSKTIKRAIEHSENLINNWNKMNSIEQKYTSQYWTPHKREIINLLTNNQIKLEML